MPVSASRDSNRRSDNAAVDTSSHPLQPCFAAYEAERRALLITGRSLSDLDLDPRDGKIRPLHEMLRRGLRRRYGMVVISYSFACGLELEESQLDRPADRQRVEAALRAHELAQIARDGDELCRVVQGANRLLRAPAESMRWSDGSPMRFTFQFRFGEHVVPAQREPGGAAHEQLAIVELALLTAESLALRSTGNLMLFCGREGCMERRIADALYTVHLRQPGRDSKTDFTRAVLGLYPEARVEAGLSPEGIAHLTRNTPNAPLEALLRASRTHGRPVRAEELAGERAQAVAQLSEETLTVLDTRGVERLELVGRNVEVPLRVLSAAAAALRRGDSATPRALVAVGPPGTAKSLGAQLVASRAGVAAFDACTPKSSLVGETERKARLQLSLQREWAPNVVRHDEITESLPLQRQEFNGDSGCTNAWIAMLLTSFADETLRGRSLLIGTTNCPWRIGEAQRSRLEFLPFLFPLRHDFPAILAAIVRNFGRGIELDPSDPQVASAAEIFYGKGAGPRAMVQSLNRTLMRTSELGPAEVLTSARDYCGSCDRDSVIYADLWAVAVTSCRSYLPWGDRPADYPFPDHLRPLIDSQSGEIDRKALRKTIERLKPNANV